MSRHMILAVVLILAVSATAAAQPAVPVDWGRTFVFSSQGGFVNPLFRVGFNPQPEPPGDLPILDLSDLTQPIITVPEAGFSSGDMRMLFGISSPYTFNASGGPVGSMYSFLAEPPGGSLLPDLTIELDMNTGGGGVPVPGSWAFFNPQPEPPLPDASPDGLGIDFTFDITSPGTLTFRVLENGIDPLTFTVIPEPSAMVLGLLALGGLCCVAWSRRRGVNRRRAT